jgi:hypothetical protein
MRRRPDYVYRHAFYAPRNAQDRRRQLNSAIVDTLAAVRETDRSGRSIREQNAGSACCIP